MVSLLKSHPFAVEAYFERSLVLAYAFPPEVLRPKIPSWLELDTHTDEHGTTHGFAALAMVKTRHLRPAGFPKWLGRDFSLIGHRVFVRYQSAEGKELRGLYILQSNTDRRIMKFSGNLFTRYNYKLTDVAWGVRAEESGTQTLKVRAEAAGFDVVAEVPSEDSEPPLPEATPFDSWKEARRFAGPMPYTFSVDDERQQMVIIRGVRTHWRPRPVTVIQDTVQLAGGLDVSEARLANAFLVEDVPYRWEKGRTEPLSEAP